MLNIYLARHGQDEDNFNGKLNGRRDTPLTEKGIVQAQELAQLIKNSGIKFEKIYSSPLIRTYKTAKIIAETNGVSKPDILQDLIERDFGILTGRSRSDIPVLCTNYMFAPITGINYMLEAEGLETFPKALLRAKGLLKLINSKHSDGNILLVTHGDIGKIIYAAYYDLSWKRVLKQFHFGNADLLLLSEGSSPDQTHVFNIKQFNL